MNPALRTAALAGLAGSLVLAFVLPRIHPSPRWTFGLGRAEAVARAREIALSQGLDTTGWMPSVHFRDQDQEEFYLDEHPDVRARRGFGSGLIEVRLAAGANSFTVRIASNGSLDGWERRDPPPAPGQLPQPPGPPARESDRRAAEAAFHLLAGAGAAGYSLATDGAETRDGLRFGWEPVSPDRDWQRNYDFVVRRGVVFRADTRDVFSKELAARHAAFRDAMDWRVLLYLALLSCIVFLSASLFALGTIRRKVSHRFALTSAFLSALAGLAVYFAGTDRDKIQISSGGNESEVAGIIITALLTALLAWVVSGAGLFAAGVYRRKWWSLRLFTRARIFSAPVGVSLCAGLLTAPALAAVPVMLAFLFPRAHWDDSFDFLARYPELQFRPGALTMTLGFLGVAVSAFLLRVGSPWLRRGAIAIAGMSFFLGLDFPLLGSAPAALLNTAGFLAVVLWLFFRFDVMAALTAHAARFVIFGAATLLLHAAPSLRQTGWRVLAVAACALAASVLVAWKGKHEEDDSPAQPQPLRSLFRSEREELKLEFGIARRAQQEMLPAAPPRLAGFGLAASCTPAREVGGDLYDFVPLEGGRVGITVADVSGKGVPAALYMTLTKGLLTATSQDNLQLPHMLEQVNRHLYAVGRRKTFVTLAMAVLDPASKTVEYASAGHNPAVLRKVSDGSTKLLSSRGLGLGITGGPAFSRALEIENFELASGDALVLYSDGLTEAMNEQLEQFGEERLLRAIEKTDGMAAAAARDSILAEVSAFLDGQPPQDDLTLVVLRAGQTNPYN